MVCFNPEEIARVCALGQRSPHVAHFINLAYPDLEAIPIGRTLVYTLVIQRNRLSKSQLGLLDMCLKLTRDAAILVSPETTVS